MYKTALQGWAGYVLFMRGAEGQEFAFTGVIWWEQYTRICTSNVLTGTSAGWMKNLNILA